MRKHWVGLLSMLGLAGSVVPAVPQVIKGKGVAQESKAKFKKAQSQKNASMQAGHAKWKKGAAETSSVQSDAAKKSRQLQQETLRTQQDKWKKGATETNSAQSDATKKGLQLRQETLRTQQNANDKGDKNALTKAGLTKASGNQPAATKATGPQ